jgi:type VI secretion system secreted protein VgrG
MALDQQNRRGRMLTALPEGTFGLTRLEGTDSINELFEYRVSAVSEEKIVDFDDLIGTDMTIRLEGRDNAIYFYNGIVTDANWGGAKDGLYTYQFILRPWMWLASQRRNQRIFHKKSAPDIIVDVLSAYATDYNKELTGTYPVLEYTVQYGETDLSFVCRLMERYGINFSFHHEAGKHLLVLSDANENCPQISSKEFIPTSKGYDTEEHFHTFAAKRQLATGAIKVQGYNFTKPTGLMDNVQSSMTGHTHGDIESYDYTDRHVDSAGARAEAEIRLKQERVRDERFRGEGDVGELKSGYRMKLTGEQHPAKLDRDTEYLCVRAMHLFVGESFNSGGGSGEAASYNGTFEFLHIETPCVPERKTYDMRMPGPQTAHVVGAKGDEIDVDEHGRILVNFHWDMEGIRSMRCRVAQMWAGNGWGTIYTPRIGMEVVVDFIEGDPDKPIVVGCVYNGDNKPPFALPAEKNVSGIKSDSTKGGGGFNEYSFDDTTGEQLIAQHAQKDMLTKVLNDETREVDHDRTTTIGNDETRVVKNDEKHTIENDSTWLIEGNRKTEVKGTETLEVVGKTTIKSKSDILIDSATKITLKVGKTTIVMDTMNIKFNAPMNLEGKAKMNVALDAGMNMDLTAKMNLTAKGSMMLTTEAGMMATHKAGGIMTIQGTLVKIN